MTVFANEADVRIACNDAREAAWKYVGPMNPVRCRVVGTSDLATAFFTLAEGSREMKTTFRP